MKIEYRKGNLLDTEIVDIIHGCNSKGVMGGGVALAIRNKYPLAYEQYASMHSNYGLIMGMVYSVPISDKRVVHNAITQENFGYGNGEVFVSYLAIAEAMKQLDGDMDELALPLIGAGLANGDWYVISAIIENTLKKTKPVVIVLPQEWHLVEKYL